MLSQQDQRTLASWEDKFLDPDYDMALLRFREPARCPACGSIEHNGDRCSWCHSELEES